MKYFCLTWELHIVERQQKRLHFYFHQQTENLKKIRIFLPKLISNKFHLMDLVKGYKSVINAKKIYYKQGSVLGKSF